MFSFVANWDQAVPSSAVDMSGLNAKPAGTNGRIVVKDGHFVESKSGHRVKFLGVNFTTAADFPNHRDAEVIAVRLARMGINIVRIHHEDARSTRWPWSPLWVHSTTQPAAFSADGQDRLDYLIAQLKKNGVYVNLNLHVSNTYYPCDGFPASVLDIPTEFDKRVDEYDRRMIELQKQFARDYLRHVNPYTGLAYTDDPCVAVVEINNENSLTGWPSIGDEWWWERVESFTALPEPFRGELLTMWNKWLARKYTSDTALRSSWISNEQLGTPVTAENLLARGGGIRWELEDQTHAAKLEPDGDSGTIRVDAPTLPDAAWKVQALAKGVDLSEGASYVLTFRAKSTENRPIAAYGSIDIADWHGIGFHDKLTITPEWQEYRIPFWADSLIPGHNRIAFEIGGATSPVWLSNVVLRRASRDEVLPEGQSLANGTVGLPSRGAKQACADWIQFLADTERSYADEMRAFLHHDLGVKSCIIESQVNYGGLSGMAREADSDFTDAHAYWQHPEFPGTSWDPDNWFVKGTPMVQALADGQWSTLETLACNRVAGKPFTVSEYSEPAPNDYQAEMMPIIASYAALQDWDMIYLFEYGGYSAKQPQDRIQGFFSVAQNPAKETFFPSAALIFRSNGMPPLASTTTLSVAPKSIDRAGDALNEWSVANGGRPEDLFAARLQTRVASKAALSSIARTKFSDANHSSVRIQRGGNGAIYVSSSDKAISAAGFFGGQTIELGPAAFAFPSFGNNFGAFTLVTLDGKPIASSNHELLTITGKAENLDMGWNANRTSVGSRWGRGPVQAEGIPVMLTLPRPGLRVWALSTTGERTSEVPIVQTDGKAVATLGPQYRTVWYDIGVN
ncbi:MAG: hypothetical protein P4L33_20775 [Capsulimonadaceae bacterium]|nr:hypothetical protein [Capsulimonadaceae bacterium]